MTTRTFKRSTQGGFTLIELAIVLVIIGLIIGAVLKGQDLIDNARAKKLASFIRQSEIAQWTIYDRIGRFAGDGDSDGYLGEDGESVEDTMDAQKVTTYSGTTNIGGLTFYVLYGQYGAWTDPSEPAILICKNATCTSAFTETEIIWAQSVDVAIDGSADAITGKLAGLDGQATNTYAGREITFQTNAGTLAGDADWTANANIYGILYFFATQGL